MAIWGVHLKTFFAFKCCMLQAVYLEIINFFFFFFSSGSQIVGDEVMQTFMKERQLNGDFISKVSDALWRRAGLSNVDAETNIMDENTEVLEVC